MAETMIVDYGIGYYYGPWIYLGLYLITTMGLILILRHKVNFMVMLVSTTIFLFYYNYSFIEF